MKELLARAKAESRDVKHRFVFGKFNGRSYHSVYHEEMTKMAAGKRNYLEWSASNLEGSSTTGVKEWLDYIRKRTVAHNEGLEWASDPDEGDGEDDDRTDAGDDHDGNDSDGDWDDMAVDGRRSGSGSSSRHSRPKRIEELQIFMEATADGMAQKLAEVMLAMEQLSTRIGVIEGQG